MSSGSISINDDSSVQVLAEEAHPLDRLDAQVKKIEKDCGNGVINLDFYNTMSQTEQEIILVRTNAGIL